MTAVRKSLVPLLTAGAVALLALQVGSGGSTVVRIQLIDAATGKPVPAMVCITGASDGAVRVPPDGRKNPAFNRVPEFTGGISFSPDRNWVGPVRRMTGKGDNRDRSYVYGMLRSVPYWHDPAMFQTSGDFSIQLPEGRWKISVARGNEFVPVKEVFTTAGGSLEKKITLERWIDLPSEGWYSGDVHVHHPTTEKVHRDFLLEYAKAEDVHVVNVLEQHHHGGVHSRQWGFGKKFRVEKDGRWLVAGQEAPSSTFGHIIGLNGDRLVSDREIFDFYDVHFRRMHENPEALVGYAHFSWNGCNLPRGFPWIVTTKEIDFVELMQFAKVNALDYYDYLNLGFRLSAAAGSDVPWGSTMGECRTYVYTGSRLDVDRWFDGLKRGRTFVTNGPALSLTVDGNLPGSTLQKRSGGTAVIRAEVKSHPRIGKIKSLRLVSNEGILEEAVSEGEKTRAAIRRELTLDQSRWVAAAAECENGALAHTSPVYLVVDGRPTWSAEKGPALIDKQLAAAARIEKEFAGKDDPRSRGIVERLEKAKRYYAALKERMMESGRRK